MKWYFVGGRRHIFYIDDVYLLLKLSWLSQQQTRSGGTDGIIFMEC